MGPVVSGATLPAILGFGGAPPQTTVIGASGISIGAQTAGLPCSNCGPTEERVDVAIPVPMYVVQRGQPLTVTLTSENMNYTGPCSFEYAIKQGATIVTGGTRNSSGCTAPPGTGYITTWSTNLPATVTPGPAVLVGALVAGSNAYSVFQQILIE